MHICVCICVCMHVCMFVYIYSLKAPLFSLPLLSLSPHLSARSHTYTHPPTQHARTHARTTHAHTHTRTHTETRKPVVVKGPEDVGGNHCVHLYVSS
jgi:hypothetical protein